MILRGLDAIHNYLEAEKEKNFKAWGKRHGLGLIRPAFDYGDDYNWADEGWGGNVVSDHDEDYVLDALWDIPNR